ncbi:MAG: divalent-cation tolerance protein CutA [Deltaproteobacteria bacterium]|nr:divalent-cation tolerance protein CutA [Deltaproteobacteria bacterium]MBW2401593.1 divalent-cation tolerance protein CutA [Deltaproteobacteria bacterium]MBW2665016.1 divalent-cation tolerance protein CutA [Deltaproteobacteria bacterium]
MAAPETELCAVLTTAPDEGIAAMLARTLVEERLAACVNLIPGARSIYRWQGALQDDSEVVLIIKSHRNRTQALAARIKDLHPYELPEVLVLPVSGGSAPYLDWIATETRE